MTRPLPTADVVQGRAFTLDIPARSESIPVLDEKVTVSVRVFDGMQRVVQTYTEPRACPVDRFGETVRLSLSPSDTAELPLGTMFYDVVLAHADGRNDVPSSGFWRVRPEPPVTPPGPSFAHHVFLDHDHAQQDALRYVAPWGSPVPDAVVQVFLRADYEAHRFNAVGVTKTREDGRWAAAVPVIPGYDYVVQFSKPNEAGPDTVIVTV